MLLSLSHSFFFCSCITTDMKLGQVTIVYLCFVTSRFMKAFMNGFIWMKFIRTPVLGAFGCNDLMLCLIGQHLKWYLWSSATTVERLSKLHGPHVTCSAVMESVTSIMWSDTSWTWRQSTPTKVSFMKWIAWFQSAFSGTPYHLH